MKSEKSCFKEIYKSLAEKGKECSPRGLLIKEIENFHYDFPPYVRFANFESRRLNLNYIKHEFIWYLKGDKFDKSIVEHAKLWGELINEDGSINSNYGQYIFKNGQFEKAKRVLLEDKDSRRASIVILNENHLFQKTKDVPCTYSINFRIRNGELNMSVHMRSQDAIYGMGNDIPAFSFIHEMMFVELKRQYVGLRMGNYHHNADSFHIYERHFPMLEKIINNDNFIEIEVPKMKLDEPYHLMHTDLKGIANESYDFRFTRWLLDNKQI